MMLKRLQSAAVAALVVLASACDSGTNDTTSLSILLKDAPDNILSAVVTIDEVNLVGSDGVVVLTGTPTTVDLLTLANDAVDLVTDVTIPATAFCSDGLTASDAPLVKPGRKKPKPNEASAKPIVVPYMPSAKAISRDPAAAVTDPHITIWRGSIPR
jgi:hypothetical protein